MTLPFWQLVTAVSIGPALTFLAVLFGVFLNNRYIDARVGEAKNELRTEIATVRVEIANVHGEVKLIHALLDIVLKKLDELEARIPK